MKDLIARLEAAPEGSRGFDEEIFELIEGRKRHISTFEQYEPSERLPYYTTSLDSALTLVPEKGRLLELGQWQDNGRPDGWFCQVTRWFKTGEYSWEDRGFAVGIVPYGESRKPDDLAPTPALALCIAALKARESQP